MDAAPPPVAEEPPARDWSLLPLDVLSSVFVRVSSVDVLMGAGVVCRSWLNASKLSDLWRVVQMDDDNENALKMDSDMLRAMAKAAVDRSDARLQVFAGKLFVTKELLKYILEKSPSLSTLRLVSCFSNLFSARVADVLRVSPVRELRSLELENVCITMYELTAVLENCPVLEVLMLRYCNGLHGEDEHVLRAKFARIKNLTFKCYERYYYYSCCPECG